jgi:serine/threonine protein kinase
MDIGYGRCVTSNNYRISEKIYKVSNNGIVADFEKGDTDDIYVGKIMIVGSKNSDSYKVAQSEINALKYLNKMFDLPFFVSYIDDFECPGTKVVVMEKINGKTLSELKESHNSSDTKFWSSLLYQLVLIVKILENNKILHNDFWDGNI